MRLIDADALISRVVFHTDWSTDIKVVIEDEVNAEPTVEPERMKLIQEAVNTIMNMSNTDSLEDKCFRNAARFIQNAIDGKPQDFELISDETKIFRWISMLSRKEKRK